jgi:hypothetical protein
MYLFADEIYADFREDDYPNSVGFRDNRADYCLILSRFSDMEPDDGTVEVLVRDQIHTKTATLVVELKRSEFRIRLDEDAASKLLGVGQYTVDFKTDDQTFRRMVHLLRVIFEGLPGLTISE